MSLTQPPTKDCRSCCTRRIRCDRTLPHCIKCQRKGIECPGYGPWLRWTNAIASRGRYKGLNVPNAPPEPSESEKTTPESMVQSPTEGSIPSVSSSSEVFADPIANELMQYYAAEIAPANVWIHSAQNEYTRLVLPLAKVQPVLGLAIISIAAAHKPVRSAEEVELARTACQKAVLLVTERIRRLASMNSEEVHSHFDHDPGTSEAALAATLVLSNFSLLESDASLALFHIQAARVLIKTLTCDKTAHNDLFVFLKNQVSALDVMACTTLFNPSHIRDAVLPELGHVPVVFGSFMNIIHNITVRSIEGQDDKYSNHHFPLLELEDEFELARGASLLAAGRLTEHSSSSVQRDTTRLVESFHHAGVIYACRRICIPHSDRTVQHHRSKLFRLFEQFEDMNAAVGNLSWPIFIGGICCHDNHAQMSIVRDLCRRLASNSPFKYYANLLTFLEDLWRSQHHDWILLARELDEKGIPIFAA